MNYSIAVAQPWHCGAIARRLRYEQRSIAISLRRDAHRDLRAYFDSSGITRAWVSDGRVLAIMGVSGTLMASEGAVWLALSEEATRYPKAIIRESRRVLDFIMTVKTRLYATPSVDDPASIRFARHLGFKPIDDPTAPYGTVPMVRTREESGSIPFLVVGLPRSRTKWLSEFLSYREWRCGHDEMRHFRHMEDAKAWLSQPFTGSAETAAAPFWRLFSKLAPGARIVVVRREPDAVVRSILAQCPEIDRLELTKLIRRLDRKLDQIEKRVPNVLSIAFDDLNDESVCAKVFEHCLPYPHDREWWKSLASLNLQASMRDMMRYAVAYKKQLDRAAGMAKQAMLNGLSTRRVSMDGMTFQTESLDSYEEGVSLFGQHALEVGEAPDSYTTKNFPLLKAISDAGALQIVTARSNGRLFGYLMTEISPSRESAMVKTGVHTAFFASKAAPGLGLKLQREALRLLKKRGVTEVLFRAGVRGEGPRLGTMYRRLGAAYDGELYRLSMAG